LDSGDSVSAISENLFQVLSSASPQTEIPLFRFTGIFLTTAISNISVKIKSQIYLNFSINDYETSGIFLIVPQISTPLILGTDWLLVSNVTIDYGAKEISLPTLQNQIPFKFRAHNDLNSLINSLKNINISEDNPLIYESLSIQ
jgi:hypothetical protein